MPRSSCRPPLDSATPGSEACVTERSEERKKQHVINLLTPLILILLMKLKAPLHLRPVLGLQMLHVYTPASRHNSPRLLENDYSTQHLGGRHAMVVLG